MSLPFIDESGKTYGRWKVLSDAGNNIHGARIFLCLCECGTRRKVAGARLRSGESNSCGCLNREIALVAMHNAVRKHGRSNSVEYRIWKGIKARCSNPKNNAYKNYGGRGITICPKWETDFSAFFLDVGSRPSSQYSIDRIDNNRGYEPDNVRWATRDEQRRNSRQLNLLTFEGKTACVADWAKEIGVPMITLWERLYKLGWSVEKSLTTPRAVARFYAK